MKLARLTVLPLLTLCIGLLDAQPVSTKPTGALTPSGGPFSIGGLKPLTLATADFNGDGFLDLVTSDSASGNFIVLLGNGNGGFSAAPAGAISTAGIVGGLAVADFNGDARPDVAVAIPSTNSVVVFLGDGAGGFSSKQSYATGGSAPTSIATADVNGDSKPDLVVGNFNSNNFAVLLNNGSGGFAPSSASPIAAMQNPGSFAFADFNGDHKLDIAFISYTISPGDQRITVMLGDGAGGFTAAGVPFLPQGCVVGDFAVADVNGDGKPDLISANSNCLDSITVGLGDGTGAFNFNGELFGTPSTNSPSKINIADFDGDGRLDLAILYENSNSAAILLGDGIGNFTPGPGDPFPANDFPWTMAIGDFNNDGHLDLAIANVHAGTITVLLGQAAANTLTSLALLPANVVQPFTLNAQVKNPSGLVNPAGTITFRDGTTILGTSPLVNSPATGFGATFSVSGLGAGPHTFYAEYAGDLRDTRSGSAGVSTTIASSLLGISKTHVGSFTAGQSGAYSITVSNAANAIATAGAVTVTDNPPPGLTITGMSGNGWSCTIPTCTRTDSLGPAASFSPISVTVNVAANAPAQVTNLATVSGGGSPSASTSDSTTILASTPRLGVTVSGGPMNTNQWGVIYRITVSNAGGGPTSGNVSVTDQLQSDLYATAIGGMGWTCSLSTLTCNRQDALGSAQSYPPIIVRANVDDTTTTHFVNQATATYGGSTATGSHAVDTTGGYPFLTIDAKPQAVQFDQSAGQTGGYPFSVTVYSSVRAAGPTILVTEPWPAPFNPFTSRTGPPRYHSLPTRRHSPPALTWKASAFAL